MRGSSISTRRKTRDGPRFPDFSHKRLEGRGARGQISHKVSSQGKRQPGRGAATGGWIESDIAAVEFGGFPDKGEAEAGAFAAVVVVAQGIETLENALAGVVRYAGAVVAEGQHGL